MASDTTLHQPQPARVLGIVAWSALVLSAMTLWSSLQVKTVTTDGVVLLNRTGNKGVFIEALDGGGVGIFVYPQRSKDAEVLLFRVSAEDQGGNITVHDSGRSGKPPDRFVVTRP